MTQGAERGANRKTQENHQGTRTIVGTGQGAGLDPGLYAKITEQNQGASSGFVSSSHPPYACSDGIKRTDTPRMSLYTGYAPPNGSLYPRLAGSLTGAWPGVEDYSIAEPLPECEQEGAIRAWKRVTIQDFVFDPRIISRYTKKPHKQLEAARCMSMWGDGRTLDTGNERHAAPDPCCKCGWYGWKDRQHEAEQQPIGASGVNGIGTTFEPWAEVDFTGTVVEHEFGYRAEFQRVMAIHMSPPVDLMAEPTDRNLSDLARAIKIPIIDASGKEHK